MATCHCYVVKFNEKNDDVDDEMTRFVLVVLGSVYCFYSYEAKGPICFCYDANAVMPMNGTSCTGKYYQRNYFDCCVFRVLEFTCSLQACSDSSPVSERPRTTVSVGALHPGLQC